MPKGFEQVSKKVEVQANGGGCFSLILGIILLWALLFGVTINGKHYGIRDCSSEHGVEIDK